MDIFTAFLLLFLFLLFLFKWPKFTGQEKVNAKNAAAVEAMRRIWVCMEKLYIKASLSYDAWNWLRSLVVVFTLEELFLFAPSAL